MELKEDNRLPGNGSAKSHHGGVQGLMMSKEERGGTYTMRLGGKFQIGISCYNSKHRPRTINAVVAEHGSPGRKRGGNYEMRQAVEREKGILIWRLKMSDERANYHLVITIPRRRAWVAKRCKLQKGKTEGLTLRIR